MDYMCVVIWSLKIFEVQSLGTNTNTHIYIKIHKTDWIEGIWSSVLVIYGSKWWRVCVMVEFEGRSGCWWCVLLILICIFCCILGSVYYGCCCCSVAQSAGWFLWGLLLLLLVRWLVRLFIKSICPLNECGVS